MLKQIRKLSLADRAFYHTSVSGDGKRFAASSRNGNLRLFDNDLQQLDEIKFGSAVEWVQLDETGAQLFVGFQDHIDGYLTSGDISHFLTIPAVGTSTRCCLLRADEQTMCIASWDKRPLISAWDLTSATLITEEPLPARGSGGYWLVQHPEGEAMAAVAFSGQSEEWMFWAHYARGRLRVYEQPEIEDISFPFFHPTGRELVSCHNRLGLCRVRFPAGELIASVQPEEAFPDHPEDTFFYDVIFSQDDRLLVWQYNLALYEFDLATLRPIRTVLTGAEGMTFGEEHFFSEGSWPMADGRLLTCDSLFDGKMKHRTDTLRLWDASILFGHQSTPDPTRPYTKQLLADGGAKTGQHD